ncbi:MAG: hypothetical protein AAGL89_01750 [Pseudomonadota bacterium]
MAWPLGIWAVAIVFALTGGGLAWWVYIALALITAPALWDVWRDARAILEVHPSRLSWTGALGGGEATDIQKVLLSRRFDGSLRITIEDMQGRLTRLPPDVTAPVEALENALRAADISAERHPFRLF